MPFELTEVTKVEFTKVNVRTELHGDERVLAVDLRCRLTGENTLLDLIKCGLREHFYWNKALTAGQETLPDVAIPLPNLRHPELPTEGIAFTHGPKGKSRGYRFIRDYGTDEHRWDFSDVAMSGVLLKELHEGGSCTIEWTLSYNGDELADTETLNAVVRLGVDGSIHMKLLAPPELIPMKKGYRAGKPDTPQPQAGDEGQQELEEDADGDEGEPSGPANPLEAMLTGTTPPADAPAAGESAPGGAWPFPTSSHEQNKDVKVTKKRTRKVAEPAA